MGLLFVEHRMSILILLDEHTYDEVITELITVYDNVLVQSKTASQINTNRNRDEANRAKDQTNSERDLSP